MVSLSTPPDNGLTHNQSSELNNFHLGHDQKNSNHNSNLDSNFEPTTAPLNKEQLVECTTNPKSLTVILDNYKYLDDYEYYQKDRLKHNTMRKFGLIMQSIKTKYKDCSQMTSDNEIESDITEEPVSEYSNFNQILKRHRKRFKRNLSLHRHR